MKSLFGHSFLRGTAAAMLLLAVAMAMPIGAAAALGATDAECLKGTDASFDAQQTIREMCGPYNPLRGKSLVVAGDSLTAGYGLPPDPQTGIILTYPVLVGNRNNMRVTNLAVNGAWMTSGRYAGSDVEGFSSYFDDEGFLPETMDYLTINLGANDWSYGMLGLIDDYCLAHYGTLYSESTDAQREAAEAAEDWIAKFIGTESDTGITTWLGAWNTVLSYLRTHYPQTKVGILVAYPAQDDESEFSARLRTALFRIAKKYGYPTLDCGDPDQWFCIGYAEGLDPAVGDRIAEVYTLDRCHPNLLGHQMMANSYEAWLKRL